MILSVFFNCFQICRSTKWISQNGKNCNLRKYKCINIHVGTNCSFTTLLYVITYKSIMTQFLSCIRFSFVISRRGEISKVFHDPDEDNVLIVKKGLAAMMASKLHQQHEVSHVTALRSCTFRPSYRSEITIRTYIMIYAQVKEKRLCSKFIACCKLLKYPRVLRFIWAMFEIAYFSHWSYAIFQILLTSPWISALIFLRYIPQIFIILVLGNNIHM